MLCGVPCVRMSLGFCLSYRLPSLTQLSIPSSIVCWFECMFAAQLGNPQTGAPELPICTVRTCHATLTSQPRARCGSSVPRTFISLRVQARQVYCAVQFAAHSPLVRLQPACGVVLAMKEIDPHVLCWLVLCGFVVAGWRTIGRATSCSATFFIRIHCGTSTNSVSRNWVRVCPPS
jgi:hypothetical protein